MARNETAKATIYLDGKQAEAAIDALKQKSKELKVQLDAAKKAGDTITMKKLENEIRGVDAASRSLLKDSFDVEKVLKNINKVSWRDLEKAQKSVVSEMKRMERGTEAYAAKEKDLAKITAELNNTRGAMKQNQSVMDKMISGAKGLLPAFSFAAIGAAAVAAFGKIKNATDTLSTQWEIFMGGMIQATNEFFRTLATGDWSNFLTNMESAVRVGRQYQKMLDEIDEQTRAMDMYEADAIREKAELEIKLRSKGISKDDREIAGKRRIEIEEQLAERRAQIAEKAYKNELSVAVDEAKLGSDRLLQLARDFDSETKIKAQALIDRQAELKKLKDDAMADSPITGVTMSETPRMKQLQAEIAATDTVVKDYAHAMIRMGNTTDEQLNKVVAGYVKWKEAQDSAITNTKRIRVQVANLLAGKSEDGEGGGTGSGGGKKPTTTATGPDYAAMLAPDTDSPIDNLAIQQAQKEAEIFAEKKRTEEEWTAFWKKQLDERAEADMEALDKERELTEARKELKSTYADAIGQVAGALASMFKEGSAAQIAAIAVEKGAAIAQIIFSTAVANAKAVAMSPLTFGQPWVTINTISAGASIAALAASTITSFKDKKNNGKPGYYAGGHTGPGSKYEEKGVVHAEEYVIPQEGTKNPQLKPVIDMIELARRNGSLARLDLRQIVQAMPAKGFSSGGFASSSSALSPLSSAPGPLPSAGSDPIINELIRQNTAAINYLITHGVRSNISMYNSAYTGIKQMMDRAGDFETLINP